MSVIRRLPRYYRFLSELQNSGVNRISSRELSEKMGLTASQIRQDLNCFGGFGQQGYGYAVEQLHREIAGILGLNNLLPTILIGVGNLGRAVALHLAFEERGFSLIGIFDNNPNIIGEKIRGLKVRDTRELSDFCKSHHVEVAVLCLPYNAVPDISELLISHSVTNFWNFSHYDIARNHPDVIMENVHMSDSLMTLSYRITESKRMKEEN